MLAPPEEIPDLQAEAELDGRLGPVLDKIRARGGRVTAPRVAILEVLLNGPHHATVEDLEERVRSTAPDIHQATFYRTLAALEELGVVYHLHVDHGPSVWHITVEEHEHLVCKSCGMIVEVPAESFDALRAAIADQYDFLLDTHHFVSQGLCQQCVTAAHDDPDAGHPD